MTVLDQALEIPLCFVFLGYGTDEWRALATIVAAEAAVIGLITAWYQIHVHNSRRISEGINKIYDSFLEDDKKGDEKTGNSEKGNTENLMAFFELVRNTGEINSDKDEKNLNKAMTFFDEVNLLLRQGLFRRNSTAWEYVSSEIHYFATRPEIWEYLKTRLSDCRNRGFPLNIIPFTGFPELHDKIPGYFRAMPFPEIPQSYTDIYNAMNEEQRRRTWWRRWFCPTWGNLK